MVVKKGSGVGLCSRNTRLGRHLSSPSVSVPLPLPFISLRVTYEKVRTLSLPMAAPPAEPGVILLLVVRLSVCPFTTVGVRRFDIRLSSRIQSQGER